MKTKRHSFTMILAVVSFMVPAMAGVSFYTDRSTWEAEVSGEIVTETYNEVSPYVLNEGLNEMTSIDIEINNLTLESGFISIDDGSYYLNIDGTPFFRGVCYPSPYNTTISIHTQSPVSAWGADFTSTYSTDGLTLQINGQQHDFSGLMLAGNDIGFLGIISTDPFASVTLLTLDDDDTLFGESFGMDNVSFVAVPEPMTMALLGLGGLMLRKRRKV
ncbi:MAG: PEP-CTERM sorting domain-containing protein [Phycisphaerae bacterium]|nr:PEP-CTERM sorting domain-containing protein [Phycisphaerae bacterium]